MKLKIKLRVSPITQLAQDSDGMYSFVVDFNNVDGTPLNNENVPNSVEVTARADDSLILLPIEIKDGNYSVPVWINIFNKDKSELLVDIDGYSLVVRDGSESGAYLRITKGMDEHMKLTYITEGDIVYITDETANDLQPNYKYHYLIGAQVVTQSETLKRYPYARNNGFRVVKFNKKNGVQSMNEWPGQGENPEPGGYYKGDAGQSFVYNVSAAVETGVFDVEQSGFKKYIPDNYDPSLEMPQWADIVQDLKLPKGHVFILRKSDWTIDQVMRKGVTHISHFELPRPNGNEDQAQALKLEGITYSDVQTSFTLFGNPLPSNPTDEQVDAMVSRLGIIDAVMINETQEQAHAVPPESMWLKRFYDGVGAVQKRLYTDRGLTAYRCHNYFQFWPNAYHLGQVDSNTSKLNFRIPLNQLQKTNFSPGGSLSSTNLIVEAVYLGAPDIQQGQVVDLAYKLMLFRHMGFESGAFLAGEHEFRPNNMFLSNFLDGKYYSKEKIPLDPNTIITCVNISQIYGRVFVQWGGTGKISAGRIYDKFTFEPTYWKANESNEYKTSSKNPHYNGGANGDVFPYQSNPDFPHQKPQGVGYYGYNGNTDLCRFGLDIYASTWGQIDESGDRNFLSYRIDGGSWIEAVNVDADDLVDSWHQRRGWVDSINSDGKIAWFYVNPFADTLWHELEVRFPNGIIVKNRVAGNGIHMKIQDY